MASLKGIKTRIASVKNTLKITSAMKLVASAKLHKAQTAIENLHPYEQRLNEMVSKLIQVDGSVGKGQVGKLTRPSATESSSTACKRVALVAISSSASLCGGFNNNLIRLTQHVIDEYTGQGSSVLLIPIGRKVAQAFAADKNSVDKVQVNKLTRPSGTEPSSTHQPINSSTEPSSTESGYVSIGEKPTYAESAALAAHLTNLYLRDDIDCVELLYTHYKNMAVQVLMRKQFLPIQVENEQVDQSARPSGTESSSTRQPINSSTESSSTHQPINSSTESSSTHQPINSSTESSSTRQPVNSSTILEPSASELLDRLLPQALAMRLYAILLDSSAAEHAARTFAMQTATDNGDGLLQELNLQYNKVRQQSITNELLDIVGGQIR